MNYSRAKAALRKIWGDDGYFTARSMDVYLTKLRKLFAEDSSVEIRNIHGSGFMLEIKG
jgi:two-component system OmpR family response regulator